MSEPDEPRDPRGFRPTDPPAADRRGARRHSRMVASSAGRPPPGASAGPVPNRRRAPSPVPPATPTAPRPSKPTSDEACTGRGGCEADTARVEDGGAHVFVDRKYVGNTPLTRARSRRASPGERIHRRLRRRQKRERRGVQHGPACSLKTVRLDVSVRWSTSTRSDRAGDAARRSGRSRDGNTPDAFSLPLSDLDVFSTDYAQKTLKVKKRGGKMNFTTKRPTRIHLAFQQVRTTPAEARAAR